MSIVTNIKADLRAIATPERAQSNAWFFKTKPGQYGHGDKFLGVRVPDQRKIAKRYAKQATVAEALELLASPWHEERLTALFLLVYAYQHGDEAKKTEIAHAYLANTTRINNWDLVDSSASYILGDWLRDKPEKMKVLSTLAHSENLWERRIAILSTLAYIADGTSTEAFTIIAIIKYDSHDLIQKAYGWMLREIGKRCSEAELTSWLDKNAHDMPRTALRYAIERLTPGQRAHYMNLAKK